jgi:hypothetical protein
MNEDRISGRDDNDGADGGLFSSLPLRSAMTTSANRSSAKDNSSEAAPARVLNKLDKQVAGPGCR